MILRLHPWISRCTIWAFSLFSILLCQAQSTYTSDYQFGEDSYIGKYISIFSTDEDLNYKEALARLEEFEPGVVEVPNLGVSDKSHWVYFKVKKDPSISDPILELSFPVIDELDFYLFNRDNQLLSQLQTGESRPFNTRPYQFKDFIFDLDASELEECHVLLRVKSGDQIMLPLKVRSYNESISDYLFQDILFGVYFGVILVMFFYNTFIYLSTRDRAYLFYVIYIMTIGLTQAVLQGYAFEFLWPQLPFLATKATHIFGALSGITVLLFAREFLHIRDQSKVLDTVILLFVALDVVALIMVFAGAIHASYNLINLVAGIGSLTLMGIALHLTLKGQRAARFFLAAWSVFLVSVIVYVLKDVGLFIYNEFTDGVLMAGSGVEVVLLSFALADRINVLKRESEEAQVRELVALQEKEKLVREQNVVLEQRVRERTEELQLTNDQLQDALRELKQAQVQLVNAEKMASLGQLTAGIAHEINNPINFVAASVNPLRKDFEDVKEVLDKYSEFDGGASEDSIKSVERFKDEIDLPFTLQEIDELLKGVEEGAHRTAEIVQGLKNFSRLDESDSKFANIHQGLDSTMVIMKNLLKDSIEIEKDYDESIPDIECFPGKLNQVFSNILMNAIQAIHDQSEPQADAKITITTKDLGEMVRVVLADNGPGIPEHIKTKIFEPFFTTKEVGEGTGLGLSIVYSIIEQHHGTIELESEVGRGTSFIITVPKALN